jgi:hypothetical protein
MPFEKGHKKSTGRPEGSSNKLTKSVKDAFNDAFNAMQDKPEVNLTEWGEKNPTEFYKLCSKLIPAAVEMKAEIEGVEQVFKIGGVEIKL